MLKTHYSFFFLFFFWGGGGGDFWICLGVIVFLKGSVIVFLKGSVKFIVDLMSI